MDRKYGLPENRRKKLKELLREKKFVRIMEAHDALSGLIVEKVNINKDNETKEYDGMWISSLCDSTVRGKEDIEIVDLTSRITTLNEIMEVTTKPIIFDGDTGGLIEHFEYNVRKLEQIGVSAVIIEDKTGLKRNSLFGTEVKQEQDSIENFCEKIRRGKRSLVTDDFMIIARIESLILDKGMEDALTRADAYIEAGVDGIMIHSKSSDATEIIEFCKSFRNKHMNIPLVVVPTTYNYVTEEEFKKLGVNVVIYANHLIRSAYLTMSKVAKTILENDRSLEVNDDCISIKEILNLIKNGE